MKDNRHFLDHHPLPPPPPPPQHFSPSPTPVPSVELSRRRRGRPPGSKNKPKPKRPSSSSSPLFSPSPASASTSMNPSGGPHPPPSMSTLLLQINPDNDVVESVTRFCISKSVSLSILSASGALSHFVLHHPSSPPSNFAFRGRFEILSISATIISESTRPSESRSNPSSFYLPSGFTVTVSGPQGQVIGGAVGGPLIAAGPVFIVAASFEKPTHHMLTEMNEHEDGNEKRQTVGVAGMGGGGGGIFARNMRCSDTVRGPVGGRPPYGAL